MYGSLSGSSWEPLKYVICAKHAPYAGRLAVKFQDIGEVKYWA